MSIRLLNADVQRFVREKKGVKVSEKSIATKVWRDPVYFIAFGFGSGLIPIAPGTWGTLMALPLYLLLASFSISTYLLLTAAFLLLGIWVSSKVTHDLGVEDYSGIVWDEVVGYLLAMAGMPLHWVWMLAGFFLFRLFDIWKPFPIRFVDQHVHSGLGIMLDDVLAAIPVWLILHGLLWVFAS